jgi:hypothetical protein
MQNPTPDSPGFVGFAAEKANKLVVESLNSLVEYSRPYQVLELRL